MADVRLTPQDLASTEVTTVRTAIATGNTYQVLLNERGTVLNFRKTGSGVATITVITPNTVDGLAIADRTLSIPASSGDEVVRFFPADYANSSGDLEFTTNEGTGLTCATLQR
jgi:hypothetical protein